MVWWKTRTQNEHLRHRVPHYHIPFSVEKQAKLGPCNMCFSLFPAIMLIFKIIKAFLISWWVESDVLRAREKCRVAVFQGWETLLYFHCHNFILHSGHMGCIISRCVSVFFFLFFMTFLLQTHALSCLDLISCKAFSFFNVQEVYHC